MNISSNVVILTREELTAVKQAAFKRGVDRGRFEAACERADAEAKQRAVDNATGGSALDALSSVTTALREMIETFEQPRFGGVYSMCLKRSREALAAGIAVLARKHSRKD